MGDDNLPVTHPQGVKTGHEMLTQKSCTTGDNDCPGRPIE